MRVDWRLKIGRRWLDSEDAERLAKAGRGTHVVRGLGLVSIGEDQSAALAEWHVAAAANLEKAQTWPRYMVFSLFRRAWCGIGFGRRTLCLEGAITPGGIKRRQNTS
jgi:hypothetical protein